MSETKPQFSSDIDTYAETVSQICLDTYGMPRSKDISSMMKLCGHPSCFGVLAGTSGFSDGFILLQQAGDSADIIELCVCPTMQKKGIGRQLLERGLEQARSRGIKRVILEVASTNKIALSLYRSCGFTLVGRRPGYYGSEAGKIDALVMDVHIS